MEGIQAPVILCFATSNVWSRRSLWWNSPFQSGWRGKKDYATLQGRLLMSQPQEDHSFHFHSLTNYKRDWHVSIAVSPQGRGNVLNEYVISKIYQDFLYFFLNCLNFPNELALPLYAENIGAHFFFMESYRLLLRERMIEEREKGRQVETVWKNQPKRMQGLWVMQSQCSCLSGSYSRGQVASLPGCSCLQPQSTSTWRMEWAQPSNTHLFVLIS